MSLVVAQGLGGTKLISQGYGPAGAGGAGAIAWTESPDGWALAGASTEAAGVIAWNESADSWALVGAGTASLSIALTEAADRWAIVGDNTVTGTIAWTEAADGVAVPVQTDIYIGDPSHRYLPRPQANPNPNPKPTKPTKPKVVFAKIAVTERADNWRIVVADAITVSQSIQQRKNAQVLEFLLLASS